MNDNPNIVVVDRIIGMLGSMRSGHAVGAQVAAIHACLAELKSCSRWTLGHARPSIRLRALAAAYAESYVASGILDEVAFDQLQEAFLQLRAYVAVEEPRSA